MIVKPRTEDKSTLTETLQVTELAESKSFAKDSFGSKETENEEPAEGKKDLAFQTQQYNKCSFYLRPISRDSGSTVLVFFFLLLLWTQLPQQFF